MAVDMLDIKAICGMYGCMPSAGAAYLKKMGLPPSDTVFAHGKGGNPRHLWRKSTVDAWLLGLAAAKENRRAKKPEPAPTGLDNGLAVAFISGRYGSEKQRAKQVGAILSARSRGAKPLRRVKIKGVN